MIIATTQQQGTYPSPSVSGDHGESSEPSIPSHRGVTEPPWKPEVQPTLSTNKEHLSRVSAEAKQEIWIFTTSGHKSSLFPFKSNFRGIQLKYKVELRPRVSYHNTLNAHVLIFFNYNVKNQKYLKQDEKRISKMSPLRRQRC